MLTLITPPFRASLPCLFWISGVTPDRTGAAGHQVTVHRIPAIVFSGVTRQKAIWRPVVIVVRVVVLIPVHAGTAAHCGGLGAQVFNPLVIHKTLS